MLDLGLCFQYERKGPINSPRCVVPQANRIVDREVVALREQVQYLDMTIRELHMKLDRMRDEAITHKKALDGVLDLMSQTDIFNPDPVLHGS